MTFRKRQLTAVLMTGALAGFLGATTAHASLDQCGGVFIFAEAQCAFVPTQQCTTDCTTVAVEDSCAAEIYPDCKGSCMASATTECESSCTTVCTTDCDSTGGRRRLVGCRDSTGCSNCDRTAA